MFDRIGKSHTLKMFSLIGRLPTSVLTGVATDLTCSSHVTNEQITAGLRQTIERGRERHPGDRGPIGQGPRPHPGGAALGAGAAPWRARLEMNPQHQRVRDPAGKLFSIAVISEEAP
jgi:hypothetical protein